jgi:uncharacterized membrane protein YvbJ
LKKKPRFFCDNCAQEVGSEVKSCPNCGRYFASVRCPSCGYSSEDRMFKNGCPMCGYSSAPPPAFNAKNQIKKNRQFYPKNIQSEPKPFVTFIAIGIALLAIIALFSYLITK